MATERIQIIISEQGSRTVRRNITDIGSAASSAQGAVSLLNRALGTISVGFALNAIRSLSDASVGLRNKLKVLGDGTEDVNGVLNRLFDIANKGRQPVESITTLFQKGAIAANELGASQEDLFKFTEAVSNSLVLQGTSAEQSAGALLQLSQALGSGIVRAEEFNSILEGAFPLAQAAAKGIDAAGGSVARLRQLVITGKITSDVFFKGILSQFDELQRKAALTAPTVGQAFTVLRNNMVQMIGRFNDATGASSAVAKGILFIGQNIETVTRAVLGLGIALSAVFAGRLLSSVQGFFALIAANPIASLGIALAAAVGLLIAFSDQITLTQDGLVTLQDFILAIPEGLTAAFSELSGIFQESFNAVFSLFGELGSAFGETLAGMSEAFSVFIKNANFIDIVQAAAYGMDRVIGIFAGAVLAIINAWDKIPDAFKDIFTRALNGAISIVETGINKIIGALNHLPGVEIGQQTLTRIENSAKGGAEGLGDAIKEGFLAGFNQDFIVGVVDKTTAAAQHKAFERLEREDARGGKNPLTIQGNGVKLPPLEDTNKRKKVTFDSILQNLKDETEALKLNSREREIANQIISVQDRLNRSLTDSEKSQLRAVLEKNQALKDENEILEELNGATETATRKMGTLNKLFSEGRITLDQYTDKMRELRLAQLESARDMQSGIERGLLKIQEQFGDVASVAEDVMTNSFKSIEDAFVSLATTGKFEFKSMVDSIFADITRLAVRQSITKPLADWIGGNAGGGAGFLGNLLSPNGSGGGGFGSIFSGLGSLFGFENGGNFTVGGSGGPDSQMVAFKATPGEEVYVRPKGQAAKDGGGVNVNFNISTPDAQSFQRSQGQILARTMGALNRANKRNN